MEGQGLESQEAPGWVSGAQQGQTQEQPMYFSSSAMQRGAADTIPAGSHSCSPVTASLRHSPISPWLFRSNSMYFSGTDTETS